ncbi:MAG TPA: hypothetical protein ENN05_09840 [Deltaproteobacteria bacterium]|nr:hypothetical protein [Deltaproteobacteria bacterium]
MRSILESVCICDVEESLCMVNVQDSHVSFSLHEPYNKYRLVEQVVTRAGSLDIPASLNIPEHIFKRPSAMGIFHDPA